MGHMRLIWYNMAATHASPVNSSTWKPSLNDGNVWIVAVKIFPNMIADNDWLRTSAEALLCLKWPKDDSRSSLISS